MAITNEVIMQRLIEISSLIIGLGLFFSAANVLAANQNVFYTDSKGNRLETSDALLASVKGTEIFKCQPVEAKISKSGTSIGIRTIKKNK
jgi:hypothetical protein